MRTVVRYEAGRAIWSDNVPSSTGSSRLGGDLVVGESSTHDPSQVKKNAQQVARRAARRVAS